MPGNILFADMGMFPVISEEEEAKSAIKKILNHEYMLMEQLRYTLYNLDGENFNPAGLAEIIDPLHVLIEDTENGLRTRIDITAKGIMTEVSNAQEDISQIIQRADLIETRVGNAESDISTIRQTAEEITLFVSSLDGRMGKLDVTVDGITSTVDGLGGRMTAVEQTAESITSTVSYIQADYITQSVLEQTADSIRAEVVKITGDEEHQGLLDVTADRILAEITGRNYQTDEDVRSAIELAESGILLEVSNRNYQTATDVSSAISLSASSILSTVQGYDYVTGALMETTILAELGKLQLSVTNSDDGYSTITLSTLSDDSGVAISTTGNITLGGEVVFVNDLSDGETRISGDNIKTGSIHSKDINLDGLFDIYVGDTQYGRLGAANGNDGSDTATEGVVLQGTEDDYYLIVTNKGVRMQTKGTSFYCSDKQICSSIAVQTCSDRRTKKDIDYELDRYVDFFMSLSPCVFRMIDGSSNRFHGGFIAQEVETALLNNGLTTFDFAGLVINPEAVGYGPQNPFYCLRYGEFVSLNTYMIQRLYERVEKLEAALGI